MAAYGAMQTWQLLEDVCFHHNICDKKKRAQRSMCNNLIG